MKYSGMLTEFFCDEFSDIESLPYTSEIRTIADRNLPTDVDPADPKVQEIIRKCQVVVRERNKERTSRGVL